MAMMNDMGAVTEKGSLCKNCGMPGKPCTCDVMDATSKDCGCDQLPEPETAQEDLAEGGVEE